MLELQQTVINKCRMSAACPPPPPYPRPLGLPWEGRGREGRGWAGAATPFTACPSDMLSSLVSNQMFEVLFVLILRKCVLDIAADMHLKRLLVFRFMQVIMQIELLKLFWKLKVTCQMTIELNVLANNRSTSCVKDLTFSVGN